MNFNNIDGRDIPLGKDQKLIKLLAEILDSQFNANLNFEVSRDFGVQLLEVLALRSRVRSVLPQSIQRSQQLAAGSRSTDSDREIVNSPVNIGNVKERLEDSELFNLCTEDQTFNTWVLDEERREFFVDQDQSFTE